MLEFPGPFLLAIAAFAITFLIMEAWRHRDRKPKAKTLRPHLRADGRRRFLVKCLDFVRGR